MTVLDSFLMTQIKIIARIVIGSLDGTFKTQQWYLTNTPIIVITKIWELILANNEEEDRGGRL